MIHPTAIVHPQAIIGADCYIGPYCLIGEHVVLAERCRLHSHVVLEGIPLWDATTKSILSPRWE